MGNIKNFNFNKVNLKLSNNDYWDFYLANDESSSYIFDGNCTVVWYNFDNPLIYSGNSIFSLVTWTGASNSGVYTENFGLTGVDNGSLTFLNDPNDPTNQNLIDALTGGTLEILSGETRLILNQVTGTTGLFTYDISLLEDNGYFYTNLCGGFYQGFFKLEGYDYQVLPTRVNQSWSAEFWLKPQNICSNGNTLNDLRPENKGYFFYMGTRSENKFWNQFHGNNTGCTSGCSQPIGCVEQLTSGCTTIKEINYSILDNDSGLNIPLSPPRVDIEEIKNQFLIYGRGGRSVSRCGGPNDGLGRDTVNTFNRDEDRIFTSQIRETLVNNENPFLIYGRGGRGGRCAGPNDGLGRETVSTFSGFTKPETFINTQIDLMDNSLGFKINDDGTLSIKFLSKALCNNEVLVIEKTSDKPIINNNEWNYVVIKFVTNYLDDCELKLNNQRIGDYYIYVNSKLVTVFKDIPEIMFKAIDDYKEKQLGVPFNISVGGGSQGLVESQTFDGPDIDDRNLLIEEHFAGTFIGGLADFKFNVCNLDYKSIKNNFLNNKEKFNISFEFLIDEEENFIIDENGDFIITPSNNSINLIDNEDNFIVDDDDNLLTNE